MYVRRQDPLPFRERVWLPQTVYAYDKEIGAYLILDRPVEFVFTWIFQSETNPTIDCASTPSLLEKDGDQP